MYDIEVISAEMFEDAKKYWLDKLSGDLRELNLAVDYPETHQYVEANYIRSFGNQVPGKLMHISKNNDLSLYVIMLTAFKILLYKFSGQEDIIVSSPTLIKSNQSYNKFIALRDFLSSEMTFKDSLMAVKETVLAGYKNQYYPIRKLIKLLNIENSLPFFRVILLLDNLHNREFLNDIRDDFDNDIIFSIQKIEKIDKSSKELEGKITYNSKLFKKDTIQKLLDSYLYVLTQVLDNTNIRISDIKTITEEEIRQVLFSFNNTKVKYPKDKTTWDLFEEQAEKTPGKTALVYDNNHLTYKELDDKANRLASHLRAGGVRPDTIAGVMVDPSLEMIVAILGIMKAGGAYLPIDSRYPPERIQLILGDSNAGILITQGDFQDYFKGIKFEGDIIDIFDKGLYAGNLNRLESSTTPASLAYVMYTSGSTGRPKGVLVEQKNVVRLVKNSNYLDFTEGDKLLMTGVFVFDVTTFEIWWPLLNGLTLFLVDQDVVLDAKKMEEIIIENEISILHLIPQLFNQLADQYPGMFEGLKYFLVGGDIVRPEYINKVKNRYKDLNILHMYGPTENTTFSTFFSVDKNQDGRIPIGKPISNSTVYIVDKYNGLLPIRAAAGELCVSGDGIARGYLNDPELTYEKFIENPFVSGEKMYRTGDMARWLSDGNIEFLGRIDHQVKIRGTRIELGEIENQLLKHENIKEAVVIDRQKGAGSTDGSEGEKYLCAYVVPHRAGAFDNNSSISLELREYLSVRLLNVMIPSYFIQLDKIPLTPNGKIDRRALPEPEIKAGDEYAAPRNRLEEKLVEIWSKILEIEKSLIGIDSHFFELGGHSLKATIMAAKINKIFNVKLPLAEIFKAPTIRGLSEYIKRSGKVPYATIVPAEKKEYYVLSSAQKRLYILQQMDMESTVYNIRTPDLHIINKC